MKFLPYFAIYNVVVLLIYGADKLFAKLKTRRIPEKLLIFIALIFGAYGALCGMVLFHHKISKPLFRYLVSFLFAVQTAAFTWLITAGIIL